MEKNINYRFDPDKNAQLIKLRNISFEEIIAVIQSQGVLDTVENPNTVKYSHQKMYVVQFNDYAYLVPFIEENDYIFLKTIFPSRKATKIYLENLR